MKNKRLIDLIPVLNQQFLVDLNMFELSNEEIFLQLKKLASLETNNTSKGNKK